MSSKISIIIRSNRGANGKPLLTYHISQVLARHRRTNRSLKMTSNHSPSTSSPLANNGISPINSNSSLSDATSPKAARKASLFTTLRARRPEIFSPDSPSNPTALDLSPQASSPPDFQLPYKWMFYHDSHAAGDDYAKRLTPMLEEDISTIKTFWEVYNGFPLSKLQIRDSVHFFKLGVRPIWEDPRNVRGGAWYFRITKDKANAFWKEVLMMAIGEQFADAIQKGDDLCGLSYSPRFNSHLISIWHRNASNEISKNAILATVMENISPELKPETRNVYYKAHNEHATFSEIVAKDKAGEGL